MAIRKPRAKPQLSADKLQPRPAGWTVSRAVQPKFTGDEIRAQLQNYDRRPFIDLLSEWIQSAPDPAVVALFAIDHPDRYVSALSNLARVAGFTEKTEATVDITVNYRALSDSQLEDRLHAASRQLGLPSPIIEHDAADAARDEVLVNSIPETEKPEPTDPKT